MSADSRLYVVVRADLSPGQQAVQACHAVLDLLDQSGVDPAGAIVLLSVPDEHALFDLADDITRRCYNHGFPLGLSVFHEPDLDGQATALATCAEAARSLLRQLPLALTPAALPARTPCC